MYTYISFSFCKNLIELGNTLSFSTKDCNYAYILNDAIFDNKNV